MLAAAANFPDAIVRLIPDGFEMLEQPAFQRPARFAAMQPGFSSDVKRVQKLAVDIELNLLGRGVPCSYGRRGFIAFQRANLIFLKAPLTADAVHDLQVLGAAGDGAQQPRTPGPGFLDKARAKQRVEREGGVS